MADSVENWPEHDDDLRQIMFGQCVLQFYRGSLAITNSGMDVPKIAALVASHPLNDSHEPLPEPDALRFWQILVPEDSPTCMITDVKTELVRQVRVYVERMLETMQKTPEAAGAENGEKAVQETATEKEGPEGTNEGTNETQDPLLTFPEEENKEKADTMGSHTAGTEEDKTEEVAQETQEDTQATQEEKLQDEEVPEESQNDNHPEETKDEAREEEDNKQEDKQEDKQDDKEEDKEEDKKEAKEEDSKDTEKVEAAEETPNKPDVEETNTEPEPKTEPEDRPRRRLRKRTRTPEPEPEPEPEPVPEPKPKTKAEAKTKEQEPEPKPEPEPEQEPEPKPKRQREREPDSQAESRESPFSSVFVLLRQNKALAPFKETIETPVIKVPTSLLQIEEDAHDQIESIDALEIELLHMLANGAMTGINVSDALKAVISAVNAFKNPKRRKN